MIIKLIKLIRDSHSCSYYRSALLVLTELDAPESTNIDRRVLIFCLEVFFRFSLNFFLSPHTKIVLEDSS